jgi:YidC/Oxa1 family membrane protein insertase
MTNLFHALISTPFYNGFIFLMGSLPFFDAGVIIIIFTVVIKLILLPLSIKSSKAQMQMKKSESDLKAIKEKYKDDKNEQSKKTMEYYKENGINPFSGIFIVIIQLPILIGLYRVFLKSGLPEINTAILYSFVKVPEFVNMTFLHIVNISEKSLILAFIAGVTAYFQISIANSTVIPSGEGENQNELARAMSTQMKYFFPLLIGFIAYTISSAVALYLITSNIFAIFQEYYIKRRYHKSVVVV